MFSRRSFPAHRRPILALVALAGVWLSTLPAAAVDDPIPTVRHRYRLDCRYVETVPVVRTVCDSRGRCRRQIISAPRRVCSPRHR